MLFPAMPVGSKMTCLQEAGSFMTACTTWMIRKAGHPFLCDTPERRPQERERGFLCTSFCQHSILPERFITDGV